MKRSSERTKIEFVQFLKRFVTLRDLESTIIVIIFFFAYSCFFFRHFVTIIASDESRDEEEVTVRKIICAATLQIFKSILFAFFRIKEIT